MFIPDDLVKKLLNSKTQALKLFLWLYDNADEEGAVRVSIRMMSAETRLSPQEVRSALAWCVTNTVTNTVTNKQVTHVTICNIDNYRVFKKTTNTPTNTVTNKLREKEIDKEIISPSPPTPPTSTLIETDKVKEKKKKLLKKKNDWRLSADLSDAERSGKFAEMIRSVAGDVYPHDLCNDFFRYWIEKDGKGRMKFEKTDIFDVSLRLATWYRKSSGRERPLPPEVEASLPSIDQVVISQPTNAALDEHLKALSAKYTVRGDDGEMYETEYDAKMQQNCLSSAIEIETSRFMKGIQSKQ